MWLSQDHKLYLYFEQFDGWNFAFPVSRREPSLEKGWRPLIWILCISVLTWWLQSFKPAYLCSHHSRPTHFHLCARLKLEVFALRVRAAMIKILISPFLSVAKLRLGRCDSCLRAPSGRGRHWIQSRWLRHTIIDTVADNKAARSHSRIP